MNAMETYDPKIDIRPFAYVAAAFLATLLIIFV